MVANLVKVITQYRRSALSETVNRYNYHPYSQLLRFSRVNSVGISYRAGVACRLFEHLGVRDGGSWIMFETAPRKLPGIVLIPPYKLARVLEDTGESATIRFIRHYWLASRLATQVVTTAVSAGHFHQECCNLHAVLIQNKPTASFVLALAGTDAFRALTFCTYTSNPFYRLGYLPATIPGCDHPDKHTIPDLADVPSNNPEPSHRNALFSCKKIIEHYYAMTDPFFHSENLSTRQALSSQARFVRTVTQVLTQVIMVYPPAEVCGSSTFRFLTEAIKCATTGRFEHFRKEMEDIQPLSPGPGELPLQREGDEMEKKLTLLWQNWHLTQSKLCET
ncbi:hypothetical protein GNI_037350 [Gregarina niphandrodes]|uniref:Uncharacterized protein n=1 Tax=Gregarina niphandrodes TaxID=110365 RepID=A0A023BAJ8_GRENI|nr:hypothetical protein GNI_037350 [Gregarina niphandrodes]EZG78371.1 hypothetical protein GNI_037350 [Gregarina niphandrodes]|eukprot:XP_011129326.1 hypothetical protein GNI_037350 [Gregarina niphandrodes]